MANEFDKDDNYELPQDDFHLDGDEAQPAPIADDSDYGAEGSKEETVSKAESRSKQSPLQKVLALLQARWKKNPRVFVIIAAIIIIFILYALLHQASPEQKMLDANVVSEKPVVTQPATTANNQSFNDFLGATKTNSGDLKTIKAADTSEQQSINNLQAQVESLQSELAAIQQSQQATNQAMVGLSEDVKQLTAVVTPHKLKKTAKLAPRVYRLRAIVSGRAWLVDQDGNSKSVAVGDKLAQYGTVQKILPNQGQVTTTSGKVIEFSQHVS